jgi:hypothetical protein
MKVRANGTKFGRPRMGDNAEHIITAKRMKADGHTGKAIAKYLGVSRATLYRYLAEEAAQPAGGKAVGGVPRRSTDRRHRHDCPLPLPETSVFASTVVPRNATVVAFR